MKFLCKIFGHKFLHVVGNHDFAMMGRLFSLSECYRCKEPNPHFIENDRTIKSPDNALKATPL